MEFMEDGTHSHHNLNRWALIFSVGVSILLVLVKAFGWVQTDSLSLLSSLLDSSLDVIISLLNMLAVMYAAKPADDDHRFGHNAIEDIVGLIQATFIGASGLFLLYEAAFRFNNPHAITDSVLGIKVIFLSLLGTLAIIIFQTHIARKTNSLVLKADLLHYSTDFLVNSAIIFSLYVSGSSKYSFVDPLVASLIAIYILRASLKIGIRAFDHLMDKELPDDKLAEIKKLIKAEKGILDYHLLKTRRSGSRKFIQLHIEVDEKLNLRKAHDIADSLEKKLEALGKEVEAIIHIDPVKQRSN